MRRVPAATALALALALPACGSSETRTVTEVRTVATKPPGMTADERKALAIVSQSDNQNVIPSELVMVPHVNGTTACVDLKRRYLDDATDIGPEWMHVNVNLATGSADDDILELGLCDGRQITIDIEDSFKAVRRETGRSADTTGAWRLNGQSVCFQQVDAAGRAIGGPGDLVRTTETGDELEDPSSVSVSVASAECAKPPATLRPLG